MKLHRSHGGLALAGNKQAAERPIVTIPLPDTLVLPLVDYHRRPVSPVVSIGERILGGQSVAPGVVVGTSGLISAIEQRPFIHPSGHAAPCVVVETDQRDELASLTPLETLTPERLRDAGVLGMGGAGYSTAQKLATGTDQPVDWLIINAAECEPGIACDAGLMIESAPAILEGITQLIDMTHCRRCVIAVEQTSGRAIDSLTVAMSDARYRDVELAVLPARYPSGAEAPLVRLITGQRLNTGERASERGIVCINVATAQACGDAVRGMALSRRIVTVTGRAIDAPCNVQVRFGTSVSHVLEALALPVGDRRYRLRAGGALSGFDLPHANVPITATTNCVSIDPFTSQPTERACIRCGACADVCPVELLPQQLLRHARTDNDRQLQRFDLERCITCGCCDLVCPSHIPLTDTFRAARSAVRERRFQVSEAARLAQIHADREQRLHRQQLAHDTALAERRARLGSGDDPVAAALARAHGKRNAT